MMKPGTANRLCDALIVVKRCCTRGSVSAAQELALPIGMHTARCRAEAPASGCRVAGRTCCNLGDLLHGLPGRRGRCTGATAPRRRGRCGLRRCLHLLAYQLRVPHCLRDRAMPRIFLQSDACQFAMAHWTADGGACTERTRRSAVWEHSRDTRRWIPLVRPCAYIGFLAPTHKSPPATSSAYRKAPALIKRTAHLRTCYGRAAVVGQAVRLGLRPRQRRKQLSRLQAVGIPDIRCVLHRAPWHIRRAAQQCCRAQ